MFFDFDKPLHSLRDYSSLPDIINDCNQKGMTKKQIVETLCEKGCSRSTAYSYINKLNMTTNDIVIDCSVVENVPKQYDDNTIQERVEPFMNEMKKKKKSAKERDINNIKQTERGSEEEKKEKKGKEGKERRYLERNDKDMNVQ